MNSNDPEVFIDQITEEIRKQPIDASRQQQASQRVWQRLQQEKSLQPSSCDGFREQLNDYLQGSLSKQREMLLRDHLTGCGPCRKALEHRRRPVSQEIIPNNPKTSRLYQFLGLAAVLLLGIIIGALTFQQGQPSTVHQLMEGTLIVESTGQHRALTAGEYIPVATELRAPLGKAAVLNIGQSRVEVRERSRFNLITQDNETRIRLLRGQLIVQKMGEESLAVASNQVQVWPEQEAVMSFSEGGRGSRIGMLRGNSRVAYNGENQRVVEGESFTSGTGLRGKTLLADTAWSNNAKDYAQLLQSSSRRQVSSHSLTALVDPNVMAFAAVPSQLLLSKNSPFEALIQGNHILGNWWNDDTSKKTVEQVREQLDVLESLRDQFEGLVRIGIGDTFLEDSFPVTLFVETHEDIRSEMDHIVATLNQNGKQKRPVQTLGSNDDEDAIFIWTDGEILALSSVAQQLRDLEQRKSNNLSGFDQTELGKFITVSLSNQTTIAVDLQKVVAMTPQYQVHLDELGFSDASHLLLRETDHGVELRGEAELFFKNERRGMASWLAAPRVIGSVDYVSPDALLFSAFSVKDPTDMFDDLTSLSALGRGNFLTHMADMEDKTGLNIREDFMSSLGAEAAVAIDGPIFPSPAWKLLLEVMDQDRLQAALEQLVAYINNQTEQTFVLESKIHEGTELFTVTEADKDQLTYAFHNGYLIITPNAQLLQTTLKNSRTGYSIDNHQNFRQFIPQGGDVVASGLFYENLAQLGVLASSLGIDPDAGPGLAIATANQQSIAFSSLSGADPMSLGLYRILSGASSLND